MRIAGVREFLSNFTALCGVHGLESTPLPTLRKIDSDNMLLSDTGKNLSLGVEKAPALDEAKYAVTRKNTGIREAKAERIDESMAEYEAVLERMRSLTTAAQDEKFTDLDRINMQIEMESLRNRLTNAAYKVQGEFLGEKPPVVSAFTDTPREEREAALYYYGDGSSVLERARDRIAAGREWNVREVFETGGTLKEVRPAGSDKGVRSPDGEWPEGVDPEAFSVKIWEPDRNGRWIVTDDETVSTVREKLESVDTIILMDAKSAREGMKRLDNYIEAFQKMRGRFEKFAASHRIDTPEGRGMFDGGGMFPEARALLGKIMNELSGRIIDETPEKITGNQKFAKTGN